MATENPLLYRSRLLASRQSPGQRFLAWGLYPALILGAFILGSGAREGEMASILLLFVHFAYFCGRPLLGAVSTLASEKQRGTYESLLTTGFTARQWVATLFRLCVWPRCLELLAYSWLLGLLLSLQQNSHILPKTLALVAYTLTCIPFYGAAGLWISSRCRHQARAQLQAILFLISSFFLIVAVDAFLLGPLMGHSEPALCSVVSPWLVGAFLSLERASRPSGWVWGGLGQLVGAATLYYLTCFQVGRANLGSPRRLPGGILASLAGWIHHPILYHQTLQLASERYLLLRLLACPALIVCLWFMMPFVRHRGVDALYFGLLVQMMYLTIRAATAGSQASAGERESGTWESLLSTRLSLNAIVGGQWVAAVLPVVVEGLLGASLWWLFTDRFSGPGLKGSSYLLLVPYTAVWTAFVGSLALWQSSCCATAGQALGRTIGVVSILSLTGFFLYIFNSHSDGLLTSLSPFLTVTRLVENRGGLLSAVCSLVLYCVATLACLVRARLVLSRQELRAA